MGLFSKICTWAENTYSSVTKKLSGTESNAAVSSPNSITNPTAELVGKIGDMFSFQNEDINKQIAGILEKYTVEVLSKSQIENVLLKELGVKKEELQNCSDEELSLVLDIIDSSIDNYLKIKNLYGISKNTDKEKYIYDRVHNFSKAMREGIVSSEKEYFEMVGNINAELGKDYKELSDKKKTERVKNAYENYDKNMHANEIRELRNCCNEDEKQAVKEKFSKKRKIAEEQRIADFTATNGIKGIANALRLGNGNSLDCSITSALGILKEEDVTSAADLITNEEFMEAVADFNERAEMPDEEVLGKSVRVVMSHKSYDAAKQFEKDNAEYRQKVESGEVKAPYLTKEHLNKVTAAVATGTSINTNMTTEQKTEILNSWNNHVSRLSAEDIQSIKQEYETFIKDYIEEHPEIADEIEKIKDFVISVANTEQNPTEPVNTELKKQTTESFATKINAINGFAAVNCANGTDEVYTQKEIKHNSEENNDFTTSPQKADKETLKNALGTMSFSEVQDRFPNNSYQELITAVFEEGLFKQHRNEAVNFLKANNADEINTVSIGCNSDTLCFIFRTVPDKAGDIFDLKKNYLCHSARKLGENIVQGQQNAVC